MNNNIYNNIIDEIINNGIELYAIGEFENEIPIIYYNQIFANTIINSNPIENNENFQLPTPNNIQINHNNYFSQLLLLLENLPLLNNNNLPILILNPSQISTPQQGG